MSFVRTFFQNYLKMSSHMFHEEGCQNLYITIWTGHLETIRLGRAVPMNSTPDQFIYLLLISVPCHEEHHVWQTSQFCNRCSCTNQPHWWDFTNPCRVSVMHASMPIGTISNISFYACKSYIVLFRHIIKRLHCFLYCGLIVYMCRFIVRWWRFCPRFSMQLRCLTMVSTSSPNLYKKL